MEKFIEVGKLYRDPLWGNFRVVAITKQGAHIQGNEFDIGFVQKQQSIRIWTCFEPKQFARFKRIFDGKKVTTDGWMTVDNFIKFRCKSA